MQPPIKAVRLWCTLSITRILKQYLFIFISLLCLAHVSRAQLTVASGMTPEQYIQSLVGGGIVISNVTFSGNANQIGTFDGVNSNVGFNSGVVMAAGPITGLLGGPAPPNDPGQPGSGISDNDLLAVAQSVN